MRLSILFTGLVIGFFLGYMAAWLKKETRERTYDYQVQAVRRLPTGDVLEGDAIYLWQLRCQSRRASREHLMKRGEMSAHRWNKASSLIEFLGLRPDRVAYQEGVQIIRREIVHRKVMGQVQSYTAPY